MKEFSIAKTLPYLGGTSSNVAPWLDLFIVLVAS